MNILIYEYRAGGHYLEYVDYVIQFMLKSNVLIHEYYIVLPFNYKEYFDTKYCKIRNKPKVKIIETHFDISSDYLNRGRTGQMILEYKKLGLYIKEYQIEKVFLMTMESLAVPIALFMRNVFIDGIIIHPFLRLSPKSIRQRLAYLVKYLIMYSLIKNDCIKSLKILNDKKSVKGLNTLYKTDKFEFIPDPCSSVYDGSFVKESYLIEKVSGQVILLHAGSIDPRKGTIEMVESLDYLSSLVDMKIKLVIAGNSTDLFYDKIVSAINGLINRDVEVVVIREFVDYNALRYLFSITDYVVAVYHDFPFSSGILNHAILNDKPIVVRGYGVMGEIVEKYKCGVSVPACTPKDIAYGISFLISNSMKNNCELSAEYIDEHSADNFAGKIVMQE